MKLQEIHIHSCLMRSFKDTTDPLETPLKSIHTLHRDTLCLCKGGSVVWQSGARYYGGDAQQRWWTWTDSPKWLVLTRCKQWRPRICYETNGDDAIIHTLRYFPRTSDRSSIGISSLLAALSIPGVNGKVGTQKANATIHEPSTEFDGHFPRVSRNDYRGKHFGFSVADGR